MTKILFLYETEMPTVSITRILWTNLSDRYGIEPKFISIAEIKSSDVNWCDILILIRPNNAISWRIARAAAKSGRFTITMCDDDLLNLPKEHPQLPWQKRGLIKALNNSSVILSCSRYLIRQMIGYTEGKRGACMDTVVKTEELLIRDYESESSDTVKIVYAAGGGQHESMFEQYVLPALKSMAEEGSDRFSLTFISVHPDCKELDKTVNVKYVRGMPLLEYRKFMENEKYDVGVAPLEDNDFTRCKYFNKYLEYTLSGVVGIYSNVEPYTYVIKDGVNGFLADNDSFSWKEKLETAINDHKKRRACAERAQNHVRENFAEQKVMDRLFDDIPELRGYHRKYKDCGVFIGWKLYYQLLRCFEYAYKTGFYMRREGLKSVKNKTIARLKKLF